MSRLGKIFLFSLLNFPTLRTVSMMEESFDSLKIDKPDDVTINYEENYFASQILGDQNEIITNRTSEDGKVNSPTCMKDISSKSLAVSERNMVFDMILHEKLTTRMSYHCNSILDLQKDILEDGKGTNFSPTSDIAIVLNAIVDVIEQVYNESQSKYDNAEIENDHINNKGKSDKQSNTESTNKHRSAKNTKARNPDIFVSCPHCGVGICVTALNCKIFRCGVYKNTMRQIGPHMSKIKCDELVANDSIYGCSKPFQVIKNKEKEGEYVTRICDYI